MEFKNITIKAIDLVVRHKSTVRSFTASCRNNHIIGIAFNGNEFHDLGYQTFSIKENSIFFLNQKDDYSVYAHEFGETISVHFTTDAPIDTDSFCIKVNDRNEVAQLLEKLKRQYNLRGDCHHLMLSNTYRLLALFYDVYKKKYFPTDPRMISAREYIDLHFCEPDCLKNAYSQTDITRRRFDQLFKNVYNISPGRYITSKKTELAKQLLQTSSIRIEDVAEICGFASAYYFSRVFKSETNMTPSEFKQHQRAQSKQNPF